MNMMMLSIIQAIRDMNEEANCQRMHVCEYGRL